MQMSHWRISDDWVTREQAPERVAEPHQSYRSLKLEGSIAYNSMLLVVLGTWTPCLRLLR